MGPAQGAGGGLERWAPGGLAVFLTLATFACGGATGGDGDTGGEDGPAAETDSAAAPGASAGAPEDTATGGAPDTGADVTPDTTASDVSEWTFVLTADDDPIWALENDRAAQPGWVSVAGPLPNGERVWLRERCELPECGEEPAVCGMAMPTVRRLAPGDSLRWEWDGLTSRAERGESGGQSCEIRESAPEGRYRVDVCWTAVEPAEPASPMDAPELTGLTCQTREVEVPGRGRVVVSGRRGG